MSFVNVLRGERDGAATAYLLFLQDYPKAPQHIFAFVEGRDDSSFYTNYLISFAKRIGAVHIYKCGNKRGVFEVRPKVVSHLQPGTVALFFVDKDLSDFLAEQLESHANIYTTDWYSVENYLVSEEMLQRVCQDFFDTASAQVDIGAVIAIFREQIGAFYEFMKPLTAWIIQMRRNGAKPNINNVNLLRLGDVASDLRFLPTPGVDWLTYMERTCGVATPAGYAASATSVLPELDAAHPKSYVRGKFELWFLVRFIQQLSDYFREAMSQAGQGFRVRTQIHEDNAVEILGPRQGVPASLDVFLHSNLDGKSFDATTW